MFALSPDIGPPRVIRFTTLTGKLVAVLDKRVNLLLIDKDRFDQLSEFDQREVIKTHSSEIEYVPRDEVFSDVFA